LIETESRHRVVASNTQLPILRIAQTVSLFLSLSRSHKRREEEEEEQDADLRQNFDRKDYHSRG